MAASESGGATERAAEFIWRDARLLDRHLFAHLFRGGPREPVFAALAAYQNADGGFGHALEPDVRCPDSQPIAVEIALRALELIGFAGAEAMVSGALGYAAGLARSDGAIPLLVNASARAYPRSPHWGDLAGDFPPGVNPTAALAGLFRRAGADGEWLGRAESYCWRQLDGDLDSFSPHDFLCLVTFLEASPETTRARAAARRVADTLFARSLVALDPDASGYVMKPLDWAPLPTSILRPFFADDVIASHLDALAARQRADGGWPITWTAASPACELEWRGWVTVRALFTLRAHGRLD